jgi:hypothetical protein
VTLHAALLCTAVRRWGQGQRRRAQLEHERLMPGELFTVLGDSSKPVAQDEEEQQKACAGCTAASRLRAVQLQVQLLHQRPVLPARSTAGTCLCCVGSCSWL